MNKKITNFILLGIIMLFGLLMQEVVAQSNIDTVDKYAWAENTGWFNFRPTHGGGVTVYADHLEGYVWSGNIGWIKLGSDSGGDDQPYANNDSTDWGVNHDGAGNLSGYAWSENLGWINFNPSHSQVTIDLTTGDFAGYAYSGNIGWINFRDVVSPEPAYKVTYKVLPPPTGLGAVAVSQTQIDLSWTDNSDNETGFIIVRDGTKIQTTAANEVSYSDTKDLKCNATHEYTVKATNAINNSVPTEVIVATTKPCPTAPNPPTNLIATSASRTQINLSWKDNSDDETSFKIERRIEADGTLTSIDTVANVTTYNDTGLDCGTTYKYSVQAINSIGNSTAIIKTATTAACPTPPDFPNNLTANADSQTQINLTWKDNSENETGFKIERDGILIKTTAANATSFEDTGLSCGISYKYALKATNADGDSVAVKTTATTLACTPTEPTGLTAKTTSKNQVILSWKDNSSNETGFKIERDGTLIKTTAPDVTRFVDDSNLTCGTTYNYAVKATADDDSEATTTTVTTAACPPPGEVSNLTAKSISKNQITLTWNDNSDNETGFKIERDGTLIKTTAPDETSFVDDSNLTCGTTYNYAVKATANDDSEAITTIATTAACPVEHSPSNDPVSSGSSSGANLCSNSINEISRSCGGGGETFTDDIIIGEHASISNAVFEGNVTNYGWISNSEFTASATLNGGNLTGTITNEGTIADVNFVGIELDGGTLSGIITNNSQVGGIIANVQLAENAILSGGRAGGNVKCLLNGIAQDVQLVDGTSIIGCNLVGEIDGTKKGQAKIGEANLEPDTTLSHVCLTPTVQYDPNTVTLGAGVITPINPDNPTIEDFCIAPSQIFMWDGNDIIGVEPKAFSTFNANHVADILPDAISSLDAKQLAEFSKFGLSGMTIAQFEKLLVISLSGLNSDNMGGFSPKVIGQFALSHLNALNVEQFKQMLSQDVSKLFTNFNGETINPTDIEKFIPFGWTLDLETGVLTAPQNAKVTLRALSLPKDLPPSVTLPDMIELDKGFGLGGAGTPVVEDLADALVAANLGNLAPSQDDKGILHIEDSENMEIRYSFIPDVDDITQIDFRSNTFGLSVGDGGFYHLTTTGDVQIPFIPASKNPVALSNTIGGGKVVMGKSGDVLIEPSTQKRRGGHTRMVVIFDPFIEPAPDDLCVEITPLEIVCDFDNAPESQRPGIHLNSNTRIDEQSTAIYPDGSSQTIYPTVLSPDIFIEESLKIAGVENVVFNSNGSFSVLFNGSPYLLTHDFKVQSRKLAKKEKVKPSVTFNPQIGLVKYMIQFGLSADAGEVLTFNLTISIPD